jgi:hypothetical protein
VAAKIKEKDSSVGILSFCFHANMRKSEVIDGPAEKSQGAAEAYVRLGCVLVFPVSVTGL